MKASTTDKDARLTYLKRGLVKLSESAWWGFRDDRPNHPMVLKLTLRAEELAQEIKEIEGDTSHQPAKRRLSKNPSPTLPSTASTISPHKPAHTPQDSEPVK